MFMEIRPVGAELFLADRWRDKQEETNICLSLFCERA